MTSACRCPGPGGGAHRLGHRVRRQDEPDGVRRVRAAAARRRGAAQRAPAHRAGPPRRRHRGGVPVGGRRGALREARTSSATRTSRSTCCSRAPTSSGPGYIDRAVEGVGGRSNAVTSFDYTDLLHRACPRDAIDTAIELLADMAFRSTFDPRGDRPRARGHLRGGAHRDGQPAHRDRPPALRPGLRRQSLRPPVLGTPRDDECGHAGASCTAFNHHYYTPENMTLVVVGPVRAEGCRAAGRSHLRARPGHRLQAAPAPAPRPLTGVVRQTVERPEQQAFLALGWQAPRADDRDGDARRSAHHDPRGHARARDWPAAARRRAAGHRREHELLGRRWAVGIV